MEPLAEPNGELAEPNGAPSELNGALVDANGALAEANKAQGVQIERHGGCFENTDYRWTVVQKPRYRSS